MVTRVSTTGNYSSVLANLMGAQLRQADANERVSSQKNGNDLKDYAKKAETLAAMRVVERRTKAYQDQNHLIADKLTNQDQALNQITDSAAQIRQTIADALATDRADTLMTDLNSLFKNAVQGMNTSYDGKYLFAGAIGRDAAAATTRSQSAAAVQTEATARRQSVEGVNLDEELVRLTTYQQAFNASARMIQASKDLFDVLLSMI